VLRFRLYPTPEQADSLLRNCSNARYVWNLAVEQLGYRAHRQRTPGFVEQCRQLTQARSEFDWLASGSQTVQQQALRDFEQAAAAWRSGSKGRPRWRKRGRREGFRIVGTQAKRIEEVNRRWARVLVPKVGWVRFRRTRRVAECKSYRVTLDAIGRWHISLCVIPEPIVGPADGSVVGIDRGVVVTLALSDGAMHQAPAPLDVRKAARALSRCKRGSNRRGKAKGRLAKLHTRNAERRKDWAEKASTDIARRYNLIRIEDLRVANMTRSARGTIAEPGRNVRQKAGLNRSIMASGWGLFAERLCHKATGRVEKVNPAYTSQRCSVCQHVDAKSRKSQALFLCTACGHTSNADLNAARNIAAGRAVTARGGLPLGEPLNREPQLLTSSVA
jgi:putative transposase